MKGRIKDLYKLDASVMETYWPNTNQFTKPAREVAEILSVHPNTLFRWVKAGRIECVRFSKNSIHFTYQQIIEFINANKERVKINM